MRATRLATNVRQGGHQIKLDFAGPIIEWRGPAPFYFVQLDPSTVAELASVAAVASYGWGCIPVDVVIAGYDFYTALIPREGGFLLPLRVAVRKAADLGIAGEVTGTLQLRGV